MMVQVNISPNTTRPSTVNHIVLWNLQTLVYFTRKYKPHCSVEFTNISLFYEEIQTTLFCGIYKHKFILRGNTNHFVLWNLQTLVYFTRKYKPLCSVEFINISLFYVEIQTTLFCGIYKH